MAEYWVESRDSQDALAITVIQEMVKVMQLLDKLEPSVQVIPLTGGKSRKMKTPEQTGEPCGTVNEDWA